MTKNMKTLEEILSEYDYAFDQKLIATEPAEPRDSAKLLVYRKDTNEISFDTFANIGKYLQKNAVLVLNDTKVFPARIAARRKTGGKVEILYIGQTTKLPHPDLPLERGGGRDDGCILALANNHIKDGERVFVNDEIWFEVVSKENSIYTLRTSFPLADVQKVFLEFGETPIPPYIKNTKLSETELREKYQTVFAKKTGSVAAPTASLHFTPELLEKLKEHGIDIEFVTLHVNLGTFAPLSEEFWQSGKLHKEWYEVPEKTAIALTKAKAEGRPVIAVGTTAVRTIESYTRLPCVLHKVVLCNECRSGETQLFIRDNYRFKFIDGMITNFHVPKSSLLMLVAAFVGREKLFELYRDAMKHDFRFFSFGDGMLLTD